jgi:hypothetical protein
VFWEGDIDVAATVHQNLLDSTLLNHRVNEQMVLSRVIKVEPLVSSAEHDGMFRPLMRGGGTVGCHWDLLIGEILLSFVLM